MCTQNSKVYTIGVCEMKSSIFLLSVIWAFTCANFDVSKIQRRDIRIKLPFSEDVLRSPRVVGGQEAVPNSVPQHVAILVHVGLVTYFCGGSLLSPNWVLTAAHCLEYASLVELIAGAHRPLQLEPTQQNRASNQYIIHSGWDPVTIVNDIALIYLSQPFNLTEYIQVATLPTRSQSSNTFTGDLATFSGWGLESDTHPTISEVLRYVEVNIIANLICNIAFLGGIQSSHLCTSGSASGVVVGGCGGDSGSPLLLTASNITVGFMSFGVAFGCEGGWPTVYTRVTSFLDWISANTGIEIQ